VHKDIAAIELTPDGGTVRIGTPFQLNLFARTGAGGTALVLASMATWTSSDESVAEVNRQGRVNPRRPGTVSITATHRGKSAQVTFTVE